MKFDTTGQIVHWRQAQQETENQSSSVGEAIHRPWNRTEVREARKLYKQKYKRVLVVRSVFIRTYIWIWIMEYELTNAVELASAGEPWARRVDRMVVVSVATEGIGAVWNSPLKHKVNTAPCLRIWNSEGSQIIPDVGICRIACWVWIQACVDSDPSRKCTILIVAPVDFVCPLANVVWGGNLSVAWVRVICILTTNLC